mmetsp:Transcript_9448/g.19903  ORF Transcript_9448/g.19903 Transcript_9448/m.19903 type:complete len:120 (-) Transcript_9448:388-747(-)
MPAARSVGRPTTFFKDPTQNAISMRIFAIAAGRSDISSGGAASPMNHRNACPNPCAALANTDVWILSNRSGLSRFNCLLFLVKAYEIIADVVNDKQHNNSVGIDDSCTTQNPDVVHHES